MELTTNLKNEFLIDIRDKDLNTLRHRDKIFSMEGSILYMTTENPFIYKLRPKDFKW